MKIKVKAGKMLEGLMPSLDIATRNIIKDFEGAENITIEAKDDNLFSYANGGTAAIICKLSESIDGLGYECIEKGKVTLNAKKITNILATFHPSVEVIIENEESKGEVIVTPSDKPKNYQTSPITKDKLIMPSTDGKFKTELTINREIFVEGIQKVSFAIGWELHRPKYLCEIFDFNPDSVKFIAGSGGRFAVNEVKGKNIYESKEQKKGRIVFPKNNIPNIINVLKTSTSEKIIIKEELVGKDAIDQKIIIDYKEGTLIIMGIDSNIKTSYAETNTITEFDHPYQIEVPITELDYPTKGIRVTYSEEMKRDSEIHSAKIEVDFDESSLDLVADTNMKARRTIDFENVKTDAPTGASNKIELLCYSLYLAELTNQGYDSGKIRIRFIQQDKPIVVDFPDRVNETKGVVEKYTMFFVTTKK